MMAEEQPVAYRFVHLDYMGRKVSRYGTHAERVNGHDPIEIHPLYTRPSTPPAVSDDLVEEIRNELGVQEMVLASPLELDRLKAERIARAILPILHRREQQAAEAMKERCATKATSFLIGDPKKGIPLRSPSPHAIADAIRSLTTEVGEGKGADNG